jgi:hypothetical protein
LLLLLLNPVIDPNEDVGKEEVLRRLEFFVTTVQTRRKNAAIKAQHSWWPMKGSKAIREPFLGFSMSMTLCNQLGISNDSLSKALPGSSKSISELRLRQMLSGSFVFRKLGDSKCVAVASKEGELAWAESPDAVPTTGNVVGKECSLAKQLCQSITRKHISSSRRHSIVDHTPFTTSGSTGSAPASISTRTESIPVPPKTKNNFDSENGLKEDRTMSKRQELLYAMISGPSRTEIVKEVDTLINLYESKISQLENTIANLESIRDVAAEEAHAAKAIMALANESAATTTSNETSTIVLTNDASKKNWET